MSRHPWETPAQTVVAFDFLFGDNPDPETILGSLVEFCIGEADSDLKAAGVAEGIAGLPDDTARVVRAGARAQAVAVVEACGFNDDAPRMGRPPASLSHDTMLCLIGTKLRGLRPDYSQRRLCQMARKGLGEFRSISGVSHAFRRGGRFVVDMLRLVQSEDAAGRPLHQWADPELCRQVLLQMGTRAAEIAEDIAKREHKSWYFPPNSSDDPAEV